MREGGGGLHGQATARFCLLKQARKWALAHRQIVHLGPNYNCSQSRTAGRSDGLESLLTKIIKKEQAGQVLLNLTSI